MPLDSRCLWIFEHSIDPLIDGCCSTSRVDHGVPLGESVRIDARKISRQWIGDETLEGDEDLLGGCPIDAESGRNGRDKTGSPNTGR
jgi:hypothetical protein